MLIWLVAAALLHDLVALPFYCVLLRVAHGAAEHGDRATRRGELLALNAVRIPAGLSLLLLLVLLPADPADRPGGLRVGHDGRQRSTPTSAAGC